MSTSPAPSPAGNVPPAKKSEPAHGDGFSDVDALDLQIEKKIDAIEMLGEEEAAGLAAPGTTDVTSGMRYLHCSRTIHQLVTDRNRAVGIYLAVASLLWTASSAILNARAENLRHLIVPIETVQRWCLPATFAALTVLALFAGFLLIRTRIGLIYEVAKMNLLLHLPLGRVKRVNPLSIFFIMHLLISVAGGCSGTLFVLYVLVARGWPSSWGTLGWSAVVGVVITVVLVLLYIITVRYTTADEKLQDLK